MQQQSVAGPFSVLAGERKRSPWQLRWIVAGIVGGTIGGTWDIAWHMSVGRDSFWTAPHTVIYFSVAIAGLAAGSLVAGATRNPIAAQRGTVHLLGMRGELGAFIILWGCLAMLAAAPFDNWWHNAYGLDVKIVSPPHTLLSLGSFSLKIGALALIAGLANRPGVDAKSLRRQFFLVGGIALTQTGLVITEPTWTFYMHSARCYLAAALAFPALLIALAQGARSRWGCTAAAAVYTAVLLGFEWVLPLFPAQPKLGPVYQHITHLVPLRFPLLLLVPALALDCLFQKTGDWRAGRRALLAGPVFVLGFLLAQWPFADFLMSPGARNWVFGAAYFSYFDQAGYSYDPYRYIPLEATWRGFWITMVCAIVAASIMARLGFAWGEWMKRLRR